MKWCRFYRNVYTRKSSLNVSEKHRRTVSGQNRPQRVTAATSRQCQTSSTLALWPNLTPTLVFYSVYTQLLADVIEVCDSNNEKRCIFVAQRCTHTDVIIPLWYCVGLHFHSFIVRAITPKGYEAQLTRCGLLGTMQTLHFALRIIPRTTVCEYRAYTWVYDLKLKLRAYTSNVAEFTRLIGDRMTPLSSHYYKDDQFFGRRRVKKVTIKWALFRK